ncbi:hypothetical protein BS78_K076200 [Paspalum vaginatum]|uniref:Uncharacterized protein n=1 Tax=Paspalum vaginatum TaxID=158149 RepID=A0A9W7XEA5_9POAL|nr:hypothetical protein BS78_K076200 [Paspalum vaginatum]
MFSAISAYHELEDRHERTGVLQHTKSHVCRLGVQFGANQQESGQLDEDGGHCFLKCKFARRCWMEIRVEHIRARLMNAPTRQDVVQCILYLEGIRMIVIGLLWAWWDARNKVNTGDVLQPLVQLFRKH